MNLYVSDGERGAIQRVGNDGKVELLTEKLVVPSGIAFDKNGDLIVADSGTHTIKKVKTADGATEIIAGVENKKGFADGDAASALFNAPIGIAVIDEKIFVADTYNDKIRVIENGKVSTLAGSEQGFADGIGNSVKFDTPCGLAVWRDGKILVADAGNSRIRVVEQTGKTSTFAGNGVKDSIDGFLSEAGFVQPTAIAIDSFGVIYIADGNAIRAVGRRLFTFVETITQTRRGFTDGDLFTAKFNRPSGLAIGENGNLFVADADNQVIRVFTGADIGREITKVEIEKLRFKPEEFRQSGEPRWMYNPPDKKREIAGTLGEIRGEYEDENSEVWFHNGLDVVGGYGETARFIRTEKVLEPFAVQNFDTLRELIRMPTLGYIHIRLGRESGGKIFDDDRFQFAFDENTKPKSLRVSRGTKFEAGEPIGTLNSYNHVHLIAGRSGAELNALDALIFPGISDTIAPTIENVVFYDENWREITGENKKTPLKLNGKTRIVIRAFDRMDGNAERRKLGVYMVGYQILKDKQLIVDRKNAVSFARMPDAGFGKLVYAPGSQSGYTPVTYFDYVATNEVSGDAAREGFFDATRFENGNYILRVIVSDFFKNETSKDFEISVEK